MRVCIRKSDGNILEAQSNDKAPMDSLIQNAIANGYSEKEIEFKILSDDEVDLKIKRQNEDLTPVDEKRSSEYDKRGATIKAMTVALWENNVSEIQRIEAIRQSVKSEIPKPEIITRK